MAREDLLVVPELPLDPFEVEEAGTVDELVEHPRRNRRWTLGRTVRVHYGNRNVGLLLFNLPLSDVHMNARQTIVTEN